MAEGYGEEMNEDKEKIKDRWFWYNQGLKDLENLERMVATHNENGTRPSQEGMVALDMLINLIIKEVRSVKVLEAKD